MMRTILNDLGLVYTEADGEAAFYGPKLDIQIVTWHGKEDTLITIQIDFQLAERFGMVYTDQRRREEVSRWLSTAPASAATSAPLPS